MEIIILAIFIGLPMLLKAMKSSEENNQPGRKSTPGGGMQPRNAHGGANTRMPRQAANTDKSQRDAGLGPSEFQREIPKAAKTENISSRIVVPQSGSMEYTHTEGVLHQDSGIPSTNTQGAAGMEYFDGQQNDDGDTMVQELDLRRSVIMAEVLGKPRAFKRRIR